MVSTSAWVAKQSWWQRILGGELVLQLHSFDVEYHHGRIGDPHDKLYGNGVLLWLEVDDIDAVLQRATGMNVEIVIPRHRNPPDGAGGPNH